MAGINQGTPEVAVGEPIRLGDNGEYELEHDPVTDRLIVRDTVNDKEAYVRPETNGEIGNQGAFIRSLVNGEPLADDGRTYSTVQAAEQAANGWVFVPPGTFNEAVDIDTTGLNLIGSGYNTLIDSGNSGSPISVDTKNVTIKNLSVSTASNDSYEGIVFTSGADGGTVTSCTSRESGTEGISAIGASDCVIKNCVARTTPGTGFAANGERTIITGCIVDNISGKGIFYNGDDSIIANNIIDNPNGDGVQGSANDVLIGGNRIISSGQSGVNIKGGTDHILFNNRISDSSGSDISDSGSNTLLDSNLTGSAN
jgi:hypothetical protein